MIIRIRGLISVVPQDFDILKTCSIFVTIILYN